MLAPVAIQTRASRGVSALKARAVTGGPAGGIVGGGGSCGSRGSGASSEGATIGRPFSHPMWVCLPPAPGEILGEAGRNQEAGDGKRHRDQKVANGVRE